MFQLFANKLHYINYCFNSINIRLFSEHQSMQLTTMQSGFTEGCRLLTVQYGVH